MKFNIFSTLAIACVVASCSAATTKYDPIAELRYGLTNEVREVTFVNNTGRTIWRHIDIPEGLSTEELEKLDFNQYVKPGGIFKLKIDSEPKVLFGEIATALEDCGLTAEGFIDQNGDAIGTRLKCLGETNLRKATRVSIEPGLNAKALSSK